MGTELNTIAETWKSLQPFLDVEKCVDCECLQAGITELVMALEGLTEGPERDKLLTAIRHALDLSRLHGCLGCDPCEPADCLAGFYRAREANTARCGCGPGCTDRACVPE